MKKNKIIFCSLLILLLLMGGCTVNIPDIEDLPDDYRSWTYNEWSNATTSQKEAIAQAVSYEVYGSTPLAELTPSPEIETIEQWEATKDLYHSIIFKNAVNIEGYLLFNDPVLGIEDKNPNGVKVTVDSYIKALKEEEEEKQ